ncbi:MAG: response regulator [Oligoflexia bacterium]|nr:response regulator [Oligoflexia bacterium]
MNSHDDNLKLLLIEDEADIRELCVASIYDHIKNIKIYTAENAHEAYRMARKENFDLVWTDYNMPKILGTEFILALRGLPAHANIPVILFTGYVDEAKKNCNLKSNVHLVDKSEGLDNAIIVLKSLLKKSSEKVETDTENNNKFVSELLQYFIGSTGYVMQIMCNVEDIIPKKIDVQQNFTNLEIEIASVMPLSMNHQNLSFYLGFPRKTFMLATERLLKKKFSKISSDHAEACSELANIIFGHVKTKVTDKFSLSNTPPSLFVGKNIFLPDRNSKFYSVDFHSSIGEFAMGLSQANNK